MGLKDYSVQERLNKINVDLVSWQPSIDDGSAYAVGDLLSVPVAITVSEVNGGSGIIQSCSIIINSTDGDETGDIDIVICQENPALIKSGPAVMAVNDPMSGGTSAHANYAKILGKISVTNMERYGDAVIVGTESNIGMVYTCPSNAKTLYAFTIAQSTNTYASPEVTINLGIVRD